MSNLPQIDIDKEKMQKVLSKSVSLPGQNAQIETKELTVRGNIIAWGNHIMPINNIAMISVTPKPAPPAPLYLWMSLILFTISVLLFLFEIMDSYVEPLSKLVLLVFMITTFFLVRFCFQKYKWQIAKVADGGNLNFFLNSGKTYSFIFDNKAFLESVYEVLSTIIADSAFNGVYHFDISNCQIDNSTYERKDYISNTQIDRIINKNRVDHNVFENNANIRQG